MPVILMVLLIFISIIIVFVLAARYVNVRIVLLIPVAVAIFTFTMLPFSKQISDDILILIFVIFLIIVIALDILWIFKREQKKKANEKSRLDSIYYNLKYNIEQKEKEEENYWKNMEDMYVRANLRAEKILHEQKQAQDAQTNQSHDFNMTIEECYEFFGVSQDTPFEEIKLIYKKLSVEFHPDKHPDHKRHYEEYIKKINAAYETICNRNEKNQ